MTDQDEMPFGKYKGEKIEDVPACYLLWLRDNDCQHIPVRRYIEDNLAALRKECPDHVDS